MYKVFALIIFLVTMAYALFFCADSRAWTTGDIRFDEKYNAFIEIWDRSISPWKPLDIIPAESEVLNFFGVKHISYLRSLDRGKITKALPPSIQEIDRKIEGLKKFIVFGGRA